MAKGTKNKPQNSKQLDNSKVAKRYVSQSDVPRYSLNDALRVAQAIADNYGKAPTKPLNIAAALDLAPASGQFRMLIGASSAYGLTEGSYHSDYVSLTDLGRRIVASAVEEDELPARREAFLRPRVIREFLTQYNSSKIPVERIGRNVLEEMGVPPDATERTFNLIINGGRELGVIRELKGNLYGDLEGVTVSQVISSEEIEEQSDTGSQQDQGTGTEERHKEEKSESREPPFAATAPVRSTDNNKVFITHGKNKDIVNQLKELLSFGKFEPIISSERETISKPVPDKVMDDMRSCYAAIIHVGNEIKLLDQDANEHIFLNQNVLIEIGAAMALYGRRFILLVERGVSLPSNLQGLYEVRYEGDKWTMRRQ